MNAQEPSIVLSLTVSDVAAALDFYAKAFGAEEFMRMAMPDGTVVQAEMKIGNSMFYVSVGSEDWQAASLEKGAVAPCLFIITVEDVDPAFEKAIALGGTEIEGPKDQFWGMRTSILADPFGYRWNVRKITEELSSEEIMKRAAALMG